jgi:transketolase
VQPGRDRATRQTSQAALAELTSVLPELVGGSADLAGSTGTATSLPAVTRDDYSGSTIHFGIREFAMAATLNGLSLHGGFRAYGSTFLVFSDYLRPALRLSALMRQPVIYVLTHDSVAVGEDGPTHQPVEHVESLRLIPGVRVLRPADDVETLAAWQAAIEHLDGPTVLVLTRQTVPSLASGPATPEDFLTRRGARVVHAAEDPAVDLLATGSEVGLAVAAAHALEAQGLSARVISVPWREQFARSRQDFGRAPVEVSLEAGVTTGWLGLTHAGHAVGIDEFGASGPGDQVLARFGLTVDSVVAHTLTAVTAHRTAAQASRNGDGAACPTSSSA